MCFAYLEYANCINAYDICGIGDQAWCMLLNDKVTFRMQWPQYADLQINGIFAHL